MNSFAEIRRDHPTRGPAYPSPWPKPNIEELARIQNQYGVAYPEEFIAFQLTECHTTPMGDDEFECFGWAHPLHAPHMNLGAIVEEAQAAGVPREFAPFLLDNGDCLCCTTDGRVVFWDGAASRISDDPDLQWVSFSDWVRCSLGREEVYEFRTDRPPAWISRLYFLAVGFIPGFLLGIIARLEGVGPGADTASDWLWAVGSGVLSGLLAVCLTFPAKWASLKVANGYLTFGKPRKTEAISANDVRLVLGLSGFCFDGGEMLVWKRLLIATENRSFAIQFSPKACAGIFELLRHACPKALFVDNRVNAYAPERPDPTIEIDTILPILRTMFLKNSFRYVVLGLSISLVACAAIAACVLFFRENDSVGRAVVFGIVALVGGLAMLGHGVRTYLHFRPLVRAILDVEWNE